MNDLVRTGVPDHDDEARPRVLLRSVVKATAEGVNLGMSEDDAMALAVETMLDTMPQLVGPMTVSLHQEKPHLIAWIADGRAELARLIEAHWSPALATYEAATYLSYELGSAVRDLYNEAEGEPDTASEVAFLLHGRACVVAGEVLCLMRNGYSDGAIARQRTLHEIAVTMGVIMENPGLDLADRYLDYSVVEHWEDMVSYQEHAEALGQVPFGQDDVDELNQQYDDVITRWGPHFRKPYRWAAPLFRDGEDVRLNKLEELAKLEHLHPHYRQANHYIHAGPRGALLNVYDVRGGRSIGVGARADTDFAEVGHGALISLLQCTASLVVYAPAASKDPDNLLGLMCLQRLTDDAGIAFSRASLRR